jgi:hypothetical protein
MSSTFYDESYPPSIYAPPVPPGPDAAVLESVMPSSMDENASNSFQLTGSGFVDGMTVTINGQTPPATYPAIVNDAENAVFGTGADEVNTPGDTTVVVTNPGAPASNGVAFQIWVVTPLAPPPEEPEPEPEEPEA